MSECGDDWDPGRWSGYSYSSAQSAYNTNVDRYAGRGYGADDMDALANEKVPERLHTDARSPLVILLDGTGSMGEFPEVIRKKLPVLDACVGDYLEEPAIALGMIHDARRGSRMPLQVEDFTDPVGIKDTIANLIIDGGGGGNLKESYELGAAYFAHNCDMPKATEPVLIFIGDEGLYQDIRKDEAQRFAHTDIDGRTTTLSLFRQLQDKFSVYAILKPYHETGGSDRLSGDNADVYRQWAHHVGADKIAMLHDPNRVVDVIFGLLAYETDNVAKFETELTGRQTAAQVDQVMNSLRTVGKKPKRRGKKSRMKNIPPTRRSSSLL